MRLGSAVFRTGWSFTLFATHKSILSMAGFQCVLLADCCLRWPSFCLRSSCITINSINPLLCHSFLPRCTRANWEDRLVNYPIPYSKHQQRLKKKKKKKPLKFCHDVHLICQRKCFFLYTQLPAQASPGTRRWTRLKEVSGVCKTDSHSLVFL